MAIVAQVRDTSVGGLLQVWCPGCDDVHQVKVAGEYPRWEWDHNLEAPTVAPSILVTSSNILMRCHSFLRAGKWEFLNDCSHELAGQTMSMVPLPEWLIKEASNEGR